METSVASQKWNAWHHANRLKFALVVDEAGSLRNSVIRLLREHGWLVHAVSRAEHAFSILVHIPYNLIVVDSELPGICSMEFARILRTSNEWQAVQLVVINSGDRVNLGNQVEEAGVFLATRSRWEDDLHAFLIAGETDSGLAVNYGRDVAGWTPRMLDSGGQ